MSLQFALLLTAFAGNESLYNLPINFSHLNAYKSSLLQIDESRGMLTHSHPAIPAYHCIPCEKPLLCVFPGDGAIRLRSTIAQLQLIEALQCNLCSQIEADQQQRNPQWNAALFSEHLMKIQPPFNSIHREQY